MVINIFRIKFKVLVIIFGFLFLSESEYLYSQGLTYQYFYRIYFRDKGENNLINFSPSGLLSQKAITRRLKHGISVLQENDLPVSQSYINQISSSGFKLHCTSKWMNTALFKSMSLNDITPVLSLPFVREVRIVKRPAVKSHFINKLDFDYSLVQQDYKQPLAMINGLPMHWSGFNGTGVLIAVLDGGFMYSDNATSLVNLRRRNGIKNTYDFVLRNENVYSFHNHGTSVLSILAGDINGVIEGSAPGAEYLLLRSEDSSSEFPVEEDYWAAAAEFADSSGADIISSSLGYFQFDDPSMNYKFEDMDGNTTFITNVADIAASKGILVFCSAGNERNNPWKRIIAPSDGDSVIAVGAVNENNIISDFSSSGPSADNRIKPDVVAMGVNVPLQINSSTIATGSGTSFSCPVLSGMAACLLQAVPQAHNYELIEALHSSADKFQNPGPLYGFGLPDISLTLSKLQDIFVPVIDQNYVMGPNPTTGNIEITFEKAPGKFIVEIYSVSGILYYKKVFDNYPGRIYRMTELNQVEQGVYIIRLITGNGTFVQKVIKVSDR